MFINVLFFVFEIEFLARQDYDCIIKKNEEEGKKKERRRKEKLRRKE